MFIWSSITLTILRKMKTVISILFLMVQYSVTVNFANLLYHHFFVTVYKYQGGTIRTPYNIYDAEKMDKKQLYTALSRTTELNHVHLDTTKLNPKYKIRMPPHYVTVNSYFNDDYHNGQIYKITFEHNNKLYIGSSIRNLQERLNEHVTTKSSAIYQYKGDNSVITPIIRVPCKDRQELNRVEAEYIRCYSENMGTVRVYSTNISP